MLQRRTDGGGGRRSLAPPSGQGRYIMVTAKIRLNQINLLNIHQPIETAKSKTIGSKMHLRVSNFQNVFTQGTSTPSLRKL